MVLLKNIPLVKQLENIKLKRLLEEVLLDYFIPFILIGSFGAVYMVRGEKPSDVKAIKGFFKGDEKVCINIHI
jgi:hypothetical protein